MTKMWKTKMCQAIVASIYGVGILGLCVLSIPFLPGAALFWIWDKIVECAEANEVHDQNVGS